MLGWISVEEGANAHLQQETGSRLDFHVRKTNPIHFWQAINKRENREQSLFIDGSCCWAFEDFFLAGVSKNESLFLVIGSRRDVFRSISRSLNE